jgi:glyoxylase-like metal-dependent hydrolase (beta-lactamase superfamily II)
MIISGRSADPLFIPMMAIPLEDTVADITGKAQRGWKISDKELAQKSGLNMEQLRAVREGQIDESVIRKLAPVLKLDAKALLDLAAGKSEPPSLSLEGLAQFNTPYGDMGVNAYLTWDPSSRAAAAFDTGADCSGMLRCVAKEKLSVKVILLTHAHPDHIEDLDRLRRETRAPVFISQREPIALAETIAEGKSFEVGGLRIEARLTWGHSPGGMTFVVTGLGRPVAIVGDSLFACSMGGGNISYEDALRNNREKILTLPEETLLCPGHGPLTTVAHEERHNAFFAAEF